MRGNWFRSTRENRLGRIRPGLALCIGLVFLLPTGAAFGQVLYLSTSFTYPRSAPDGSGFEDLIVKEACRRIGLTASIVQLPAERGLVNANEGIDDGLISRIAGMEGQYPNLVMVPENVSEFVFTVFTKDSNLQVSDWRDLEPHDVGIITGWKLPESKLARCRTLIEVKDPDALFDMLEQGRVEAVVLDRLLGRAVLERRGLKEVLALDPPLTIQAMYIYLNKAQAGLAPKLAQALADMKADGTFRGLVDSVLGQGWR
jgi:polar amino acid transport system substrate-binding protein